MKVVILSGIPGSGKSTLAKELAGAVVCSADDWFCRSGEYQFDVNELGNAHGACLRRFMTALSEGFENIVVDNTNTTAEEVIPYYAIAASYGCDIELVTVTCDPSIAAARNLHGVPERGVFSMAQRLADRKLPDFWQYNEKFTQRTVAH